MQILHHDTLGSLLSGLHLPLWRLLMVQSRAPMFLPSFRSTNMTSHFPWCGLAHADLFILLYSSHGFSLISFISQLKCYPCREPPLTNLSSDHSDNFYRKALFVSFIIFIANFIKMFSLHVYWLTRSLQLNSMSVRLLSV